MSAIEVFSGDAAGLRTAIETMAQDGDTVLVQKGTYAFTTQLTISKRIQIVGEGRQDTILSWGVSSSSGLVIDNTAARSDIRLRDMAVRATPGDTHPVHGLLWQDQGLGTNSDLTVDNCEFSGWQKGVLLQGDSGTPVYSNRFVMRQVRALNNRQEGFRIDTCNMLSLTDCLASGNGTAGFIFQSIVGLRIAGMKSDGNNTGLGSSEESNAQGLLKACHGFTVNGIRFENLPTSGMRTCLTVSNCRAGHIGGMSISTPTYNASNRGLRLTSGTRALSLMPIAYNASFDELAVMSWDNAGTIQPSLFYPWTCMVHPSNIDA